MNEIFCLLKILQPVLFCFSLDIFPKEDYSILVRYLWARGSAGRAPRSQRGGRGFEPLRVHHHEGLLAAIFAALLSAALARRVHNEHETKEPPAMWVCIGGYTKKDLVLLQQSCLSLVADSERGPFFHSSLPISSNSPASISPDHISCPLPGGQG